MKRILSFRTGVVFLILYSFLLMALVPVPAAQAQDLLLDYKNSVGNGGGNLQPGRIFRSGNLDFVTDYQLGLTIFDNSNPELLKPIGVFAMTGMNPGSVTVSGDLAIVGDSSAGIFLIDISDPTQPTLIKSFGTWQDAVQLYSIQQLWIQGNYCVALGSEAVHVVDISTPATPTVVGNYVHNFSLYGGVQFGSHFIFMGDEPDLEIISIADPAAPAVIGSLDLPNDFAGSIAIDGSTVYLGLGSAVEVVDVSNVAAPVSIGRLNDVFGTEYLAVLGNALYLVGFGGMQVADINDPTQPMDLGKFIPYQGQSYDAQTSGNQLMISTDEGYTLFDATDRFSPTFLSRFSRLGAALGDQSCGDVSRVCLRWPGDRDGGSFGEFSLCQSGSNDGGLLV